MATNTLSNRGYRTFMRPEQLETRVMLSASPSDVDTDSAPAAETQAFQQVGWGDGQFNFQITGTECQFSPLGLPAYMAGTVSYVMANGSLMEGIGTYQETLTPIFMDLIGGDGIPDTFVGTNGLATFSFYAGKARDILVGTVTTVNVSYIQGLTALGEMIVASTGTITGSSGLFKEVTGGFTSQSVVGLANGFAMSTSVQFVIQDCRLDAHFAVKLAKSVASELSELHGTKLKAAAVDAFHAGHDHDGHGKHDKPGKHWQSHDDDRSNRRIEKVAKHDSHHDHSSHAGKLDRWSSDLAAHRRGAA
ncbi:MAG: hypothetical protein WD894_07180 [Pirellulales bacterium]